MKLLLVLFIVAESTKAIQVEDVASKIQEINSQFATETNVFFDFDNNLEGRRLASLRIPQIVITRAVDFQFIYALDKDVLAVVCISRNSTLDVQSSLNRVLHRMHHVNVLFILLDSTDPCQIFTWAWSNGFKNSIAIYWTDGVLNLFELQPFPDSTAVRIENINETTLQQPLTNFYKRPIRTPMGNDPPRSFRYIDRKGKLIFSGLFLKLFVLFVEHYNATIEEVFLPAPYPQSLLIPDMIKALKEGKLDISSHPFLQLYDQYLCTYAFNLAFFYLMVPYSRPVDHYMYFVLPFDDLTWSAITVTVLMFAIGIFFGSKAVIGHFEFGRALLQAFSGILNISYNFQTNKSKVLLFVYILLSVVGMMLSNMYLAQLSTFLTTHAYEKQINTFEDVIASKLPITIAPYDKEVYEGLGAPKEILNKVEAIDLETWYQQRRILNTSRIDIISSEKYSFFTYQQRYLRTPRVKKIDKPLIGLAPAFALPFTSPYVSLYSDFFQRTIEAGIYQKFTDDLNDDGIATGMIAFIDPETPDQVPLSVQHFKISLFLLGSGFAMATVCLCLEVAYDKFKQNV